MEDKIMDTMRVQHNDGQLDEFRIKDLSVAKTISLQEAEEVRGGVQAVERRHTPSVESEIGVLNTIP